MCLGTRRVRQPFLSAIIRRPSPARLGRAPDRGTVPMLKVDANPRRAHAMPFGAQLQRDGTVRFRLWGRSHSKIQIQLDGTTNLDMRAEHGGWHELATDRARAGTLYQLVLPDGLRGAGPGSRDARDEVHCASQVMDR